MLTKLSHFLQNMLLPNEQEPELTSQEQINLACSVLLVEVMLADGEIAPAEQQKIVQLLNQYFAITEQEANGLFELASKHANQATDLHTYTSALNKNLTIDEKITLVEHLWQVAHADGNISSIEQHQIRKIADLLHLRHNEYIAAKLALNK